jgi:hypothetical protein
MALDLAAGSSRCVTPFPSPAAPARRASAFFVQVIEPHISEPHRRSKPVDASSIASVAARSFLDATSWPGRLRFGPCPQLVEPT